MHRVIVRGTGFVGKAALRAGRNVVDTSMGIFHYPPLIPAALHERIAQATDSARVPECRGAREAPRRDCYPPRIHARVGAGVSESFTVGPRANWLPPSAGCKPRCFLKTFRSVV